MVIVLGSLEADLGLKASFLKVPFLGSIFIAWGRDHNPLLKGDRWTEKDVSGSRFIWLGPLCLIHDSP